MKAPIIAITLLSACALAGVYSASTSSVAASEDGVQAAGNHSEFAETSYIVRADSTVDAASAVHAAGGQVTHELNIIDGVAATLTLDQLNSLEADKRLTISKDAAAEVAGRKNKSRTSKKSRSDALATTDKASDPYVVRHTAADRVHAAGITGQGVTIAFVDTGLWAALPVANNTTNRVAYLQGYNAITDTEGTGSVNDAYGHGTHVVSVAANSRTGYDGAYIGMAPDASRIMVKSFDDEGYGTYADTIRGLDWILRNRDEYRIRVVNLSFGATPQSHYWDDPLNLAVMKLWQAGIVVVASSGNWGPHAHSVTVPGNVPYVITVGAVTNNYTTNDKSDDRLASFSGTGPTYEGFVKPDLVAPGGHVTGLMNNGSAIALKHPKFYDSRNYFYMSGTSQSAAVVSGAVALMLQADPSLSPDDVKCRLLSSSQAAQLSGNKAAYSVFQQGAGQLNAYDAVMQSNRNCANYGLDIDADIAGKQHFGGPARQDADGNYFVADSNGSPIKRSGYLWGNGYLWSQGYLWSNGNLGNQALVWGQGYLWSNSKLWNNGYLWSQGFVPSTASAASINHWVSQE